MLATAIFQGDITANEVVVDFSITKPTILSLSDTADPLQKQIQGLQNGWSYMTVTVHDINQNTSYKIKTISVIGPVGQGQGQGQTNAIIMPQRTILYVGETITFSAVAVENGQAVPVIANEWNLMPVVNNNPLAVFSGNNRNTASVAVTAMRTGQITLRAQNGNQAISPDLVIDIVKIEVLKTEGQNSVIVQRDAFVYITNEGEMPELQARVTVDNSWKAVKTKPTVTFKLKIEYGRADRKDVNYYPPDGYTTVQTGEIWDINAEMGQDVRGGKATLSTVLSTTSNGLSVDNPYLYVFYIRGTNPAEAACEQYITANNAPWYALAIARHESGDQATGGTGAVRTYLQFNENGDLGAEWDNYKYCPNRENGWTPQRTHPPGWGIFQLTEPRPGAEELWNWQANVLQALIKMQTDRDVRSKGQAGWWINDQITKQQKDEKNLPPEQKHLIENQVFNFAGYSFQAETTMTPVDACAIQRYQGAGSWVIYWIPPKYADPLNPDNITTPGEWKVREDAKTYVEIIMNEYRNGGEQ
ncbi:MAG: hypothetical protein HZA48_12175 [Planctomycetes bacterium]|nr:hypothetical protein [Planctomycetota bacterium]